MRSLTHFFLILATTTTCKTVTENSGELRGTDVKVETFYCEILVKDASVIGVENWKDYKVDIIPTGDSSDQSQADACQLACTAAKQKFCTENEEVMETSPSSDRNIYVELWLTSARAHSPKDCSAYTILTENPSFKGLGYNCTGRECALKFDNIPVDEPPTSYSDLKYWCNTKKTLE